MFFRPFAFSLGYVEGVFRVAIELMGDKSETWWEAGTCLKHAPIPPTPFILLKLGVITIREMVGWLPPWGGAVM